MTDFIDDEPVRRKKWPWVAGATVIAAALVIGISIASGGNGSSSTTSGTAQGPTGDPVRGGSLVYSETYPVKSFESANYSTMTVLSAVSDRLVFIPEDSSEVVPYLASKWTISDDRLNYHFTLRPGVTFSDGSPLTSEVVIANLNQLAFGDPSKGAPARTTLKTYKSAVAEDDLNFTITLTKPTYLFLRSLAHPLAGFTTLANLERPYKEQRSFKNFVGTGAFTVDSFVPDQEITLIRRPEYQWPPQGQENQGAAYLDQVTIKYIQEVGLRSGAVSSGQVDLARGIQPSDEASVRAAGDITYAVQTPIHTTNTALIRIQDPQVSDERVRQALQVGFDRTDLVKSVLSDSYFPASNYFQHAAEGYHDFSSGLAYDPDRANKLLDEAGWTERNSDGIRVKDGQPLKITVSASAQSVAIKPALDYVAEKWRKLGVNLVNLAGDTTAFDQSATDFANYPLYGSRNLVDSDLSGWTERVGVANPKADTLIGSLLSATTPEQYTAAANAWSQYALVDGALVIPLFDEAHVFGANSNVHFAVDATILPQFQSIWIAQ